MPKISVLILTVILSFGFSLPAVAETGNFYSVRFVRCYDGDTCTFIIPWVPSPFTVLNYRLEGIDTPERRGKCLQEKFMAEQARLLINEHLRQAKETGKTIDLVRVTEPGIYGRPQTDIIIDERYSMAMTLMDAGLAVLSDGKRTHNWCEQKG